jgi:starch synthase
VVQRLKVLYLAAEATPFVKIGGLADVAGELPPALRTLGLDVRTAIPLHAAIDRKLIPTGSPVTVKVSHAGGEQPAEVYRAESRGVPTLLIDAPSIRAATGVYGEPVSDPAKFAFFCLAALQACRLEGWAPDIVHANDWHTAPALLWLDRWRDREPFWRHTATIQTIHNLAYMGAGGEQALRAYDLIPPPDARLPRWARTLPLPLGLAAADWITTVSPTYALEIQTPELGDGLDAFLHHRADRLTGILNGLDQDVWDPSTDPALPAGFDVGDVSPRAECKRAVQTDVGLPEDASVPLIGMVTRLDPQKGVDMVLEALAVLESERWQFVLLGSGQEDLERQVVAFVGEQAERARSIQRYDAPLSRRIFGGADMLLVPSRYEPCGLTQMIAQRYGCVPIVRSTGGLKDTVADYSAGGRGTGFVFGPAEPPALADAIRRALAAFPDRRRWRGIQRRGMALDHSWDTSARRYGEVYESARRAREAKIA